MIRAGGYKNFGAKTGAKNWSELVQNVKKRFYKLNEFFNPKVSKILATGLSNRAHGIFEKNNYEYVTNQLKMEFISYIGKYVDVLDNYQILRTRWENLNTEC